MCSLIYPDALRANPPPRFFSRNEGSLEVPGGSLGVLLGSQGVRELVRGNGGVQERFWSGREGSLEKRSFLFVGG